MTPGKQRGSAPELAPTGELILYQSVGDHVKGIERIQKILTYAPNSPAAERLRDRMVLEG